IISALGFRHLQLSRDDRVAESVGKPELRLPARPGPTTPSQAPRAAETASVSKVSVPAGGPPIRSRAHARRRPTRLSLPLRWDSASQNRVAMRATRFLPLVLKGRDSAFWARPGPP